MDRLTNSLKRKDFCSIYDCSISHMDFFGGNSLQKKVCFRSRFDSVSVAITHRKQFRILFYIVNMF